MTARLQLLENGLAVRRRLADAFAAAAGSICMVMYIFADDAAGQSVLGELVAAARRGVPVRIIVDGFGSGATSDRFFAPLAAAGGQVRRFNTVWHPRYLFRNHQKFVIVDASIALTGGFNIAEDYFGDGVTAGWRETGLAVEGEAAAALQGYFDGMWEALGRGEARLREIARLPVAAGKENEGEGTGTVEWVIGAPGIRRGAYDRRLRRDLIACSRLSVLMAYFTPPARFRRMIGRIARRGAVELVVPQQSDIAIARYAAWYTFRRLLRDGCRIHEYLPRPLHAKLIVADDVVYAGSANLDFRSLHLNFEMSLRVRDPALAAEVRGLIRHDIARSRPITQEYYDRNTDWWRRFLRWAAYSFLNRIDYYLTRRFLD